MTSPVQAQTNFAPDLTVKPSPEEIDQLAANINNARASEAACAAVVADLEKRAIDLVAAFGAPVPKAEASRRLEGRLRRSL